MDLLLISLLIVGMQAQDTWNELDEVEILCDSSFLQTSLHVAPVEGKPMGQSESRAIASGEELMMTEPLSFLQEPNVKDEVQSTKEAAAPSMTDEGPREYPNWLRWATLLLNHFLIFMIVVKGGLAFSRLILRQRKAACTSLAPEQITEEKLEEETAISRSQVQAIQFASSEDVEEFRCSAPSGYDCAFSRPASMGRALRFRARIYGAVPDATTLVAPLSEAACVAYQTSVSKASGTEIAHSAASVDFLATLEGAPDVQILVRGEEVKMFEIGFGQTEIISPIAAPRHWQKFLESRGLHEERPLAFKEESLRVGELVTLVGDLHRDVSGQLMLWPTQQRNTKCEDDKLFELLDGAHVLVSDQ